MANIFPIDFEEKLTMAQDDYILFSDSEDGNKIKKAQYKNLKWEPGTPWTPWADGSAATITVWSTTTWTPWSSASVTNSWTSSAAVFNFTIPQWAKWEPWEDGDDWAAATITVGTTTTLSPWSSATVTNVWTSSAAILNFGIPKWDSWTWSGDVVWPASSTDWHLAVFDGATGKIIKDWWAMPTIPTKVSDLTNDSGFITGINSTDVTTALWYTPYNSTNPDWFITSSYHDSTKQDVLTAGTNITIESNVISATWWGSDIVYATQAEYTALLPWAESDGKHYFIYTAEVWPTPTPPFTPWADTIAFYPFTEDRNDHSWNSYNVTTNNSTQLGTYQWVDCMDFNHSFCVVGTIDGMQSYNNYTMSFWVYKTWWINIQFSEWWGWGWSWPSLRTSNNELRWGNETNTYSSFSNSSTPNNTWLHIVIVADNWEWAIYVNNTKTVIKSSWVVAPSNNGNSLYIWALSDWGISYPSDWYISNLIIEKKARTAQEISDYFNATKSTYWIS